jgi:hypothetical protein
LNVGTQIYSLVLTSILLDVERRNITVQLNSDRYIALP